MSEDNKGNNDVAEQIKLRGKIKETGRDSEIIVFSLHVDRINPKTKRLIFIANIPAEGDTQAPVYVKQSGE